jgi:hypothetical protein
MNIVGTLEQHEELQRVQMGQLDAAIRIVLPLGSRHNLTVYRVDPHVLGFDGDGLAGVDAEVLPQIRRIVGRRHCAATSTWRGRPSTSGLTRALVDAPGVDVSRHRAVHLRAPMDMGRV